MGKYHSAVSENKQIFHYCCTNQVDGPLQLREHLRKYQEAQEDIAREKMKTEDLQDRISFYEDNVQSIRNVPDMENASLLRILSEITNEKDALVEKLKIATKDDNNGQMSIPLWICYIIAGCTGLFLIFIIILVIWCMHRTHMRRSKMSLPASRSNLKSEGISSKANNANHAINVKSFDKWKSVSMEGKAGNQSNESNEDLYVDCSTCKD